MARPLPSEFSGAMYHLTHRGNDRQKACSTDAGRELFLNALTRVVRHYGWLCHAYCLPTNRYHLMARIRAARPALARIFAKGGKKAIAVAYEHGYRLNEIAAHVEAHYPTVILRLEQLERSE